MARREFLQLAHTYRPEKDSVDGCYLSEKLDGTRCLWDGGVSRGKPTAEVPWASLTNPKTGDLKRKIKPVATGLWSRYGNPIMAPDSFLNKLPPFPLDGELWAGRGNFQLCWSICAGDQPDPRFGQIEFAVYSAPPVANLFAAGEIKNANFHLRLDEEACIRWWLENCLDTDVCGPSSDATFAAELDYLQHALETQSNVYLHRQVLLDGGEDRARGVLGGFLDGVLAQGGEGIMLRRPDSRWQPKRHRGILKWKPFDDSEATVVGFISGNEGKQGNILGKIGALVVDWQGVEFEIGSGLTFDEREFEQEKHATVATHNPGVRLENVNGKHLRLGDKVTFKFRELTDDGVPKEARYWRKHLVA